MTRARGCPNYFETPLGAPLRPVPVCCLTTRQKCADVLKNRTVQKFRRKNFPIGWHAVRTLLNHPA
jgi:hypothetical protein